MSTVSSLVLRKPVVLNKPQQAIRLLRGLYRETSCLFDEVARKQIQIRIRERFRECKDVKDEQRVTKLLKDGRRILSTLTRANNGDKWRLVYVLQHAYGAKGKLKHEMLKPLLKKAEPQEPLIPGRRRTAPPGPSPALVALMKAQVGKSIKVIEPVIPKETVSGKPFPRVRIANMKWRHQSMNLRRITPPLSSSDFERMEMLVMGFRKCVPPKRQYLTRDTRIGPKKQRPHRYTPRMQRRIFEYVLEQFTSMEYKDNPQGGKWVAKYSPVLQTLLRKEGAPEDFEGVNGKGEPEGLIGNPNAVTGKSAAERNRLKGKALEFANWLEAKRRDGKIPKEMGHFW
ncbi:hypothetical protein H072_2524 [Dactylellina haptotyla CBS 200.50]|uniref:LYR motif-containing protein Cup1-like N-terminal domain-containing protein n=1 Tax=Dactylellina haptotyla (strain CBS 200.50) TaxID=1284197 RepID=S8AKK3_DACHA|nr:hypothetical protein H072_2524 [Dactylellina haptotyla CBS 200.50]